MRPQSHRRRICQKVIACSLGKSPVKQKNSGEPAGTQSLGFRGSRKTNRASASGPGTSCFFWGFRQVDFAASMTSRTCRHTLIAAVGPTFGDWCWDKQKNKCLEKNDKWEKLGKRKTSTMMLKVCDEQVSCHPLNITENLVDNHRFKALNGWCFWNFKPLRKGTWPTLDDDKILSSQSVLYGARAPKWCQSFWPSMATPLGNPAPGDSNWHGKGLPSCKKGCSWVSLDAMFPNKTSELKLVSIQKYFLGRAQSIVAVDIEGFQLMCGCMACFWKVSSTLSNTW